MKHSIIDIGLENNLYDVKALEVRIISQLNWLEWQKCGREQMTELDWDEKGMKLLPKTRVKNALENHHAKASFFS